MRGRKTTPHAFANPAAFARAALCCAEKEPMTTVFYGLLPCVRGSNTLTRGILHLAVMTVVATAFARAGALGPPEPHGLNISLRVDSRERRVPMRPLCGAERPHRMLSRILQLSRELRSAARKKSQ